MSIFNPFSKLSAKLSAAYTRKQRLIVVLGFTFGFFVAEIVVAFYTNSLALLADAFHYLNDFIGYVVALAAIIVSGQETSPRNFSFGWARATLLGAFFNGVFLLALGLSIFLQSIEKFISIRPVEQPKLILITGLIGLALNILSALLIHEHPGHSHAYQDEENHSHVEEHQNGHVPANIEAAIPVVPSTINTVTPTALSIHAEHRHSIAQLQERGRDLGMLGVLLHVLVDALSNLLVAASAIIIWCITSPARFHADPAVSLAISIIIFFPASKLLIDSGKILLQSAPDHLKLDDVKHDMEEVPGIEAVHELHVWSLNQEKLIATAHVTVTSNEMAEFMSTANIVKECLNGYGIHSVTLQPECLNLVRAVSSNPAHPEDEQRTATTNSGSGLSAGTVIGATSLGRQGLEQPSCKISCGNLCESLTCCDNNPNGRNV